jgi:hypothetical protein
MKQFRSLLCAATVIIIGMSSCSKGTTGPAGPTGPKGPAGPDSVVYSNWITLTFTYNANDSLYHDTLSAPTITAGILDSGVILTYIEFPDANNVAHIQPVSALNYIISEDYSVGEINILSTQDLTNLQYRYVTIPGSLLAGNSAIRKVNGYTTAQLKAMSYAQVQQVLANKN